MRHRQLARNLLAAFLAHRLGITIQYALKAHVPEEPGPYWFALAETVEREVLENMECRVAEPMRRVQ